MNEFLLSQDMRPAWLDYPRSFLRIVEQSLVNLSPWHVMPATRALAQWRGLAERYPTRVLFPFAYRQDNDDVACWSRDGGEKVFVIHDFASPGWEDEGTFDSTWAWFKGAVEETIAWE